MNSIQSNVSLNHFQLVVLSRIDAHKTAEAAKLEAERARIQAEEEAKALAKVEAENNPPQSKAGTLAGAQPEPAAPVAKPDNVVVIEHQDAISAFLASRDFGKEAGKIRAILVEYVKFEEQLKRKLADAPAPDFQEAWMSGAKGYAE